MKTAAILVCALASLPLCSGEVDGDEAAPDVPIQKSEYVTLSPADRAAVRALLEQMARAFLKDDADACLQLFAPLAAERNRLVTNIRDELHQTRYARFEIAEIREDSIEQVAERREVFIVDALLRLETVPKAGDTKPAAFTVSHAFVIQRSGNGFALRYSEFFKGLGLRRGPGLILHVIGIIASVCAILTFYVWMGWEAWRERPRTRLWRCIAMVPLIGSSLYFFVRLVPRWSRK